MSYLYTSDENQRAVGLRVLVEYLVDSLFSLWLIRQTGDDSAPHVTELALALAATQLREAVRALDSGGVPSEVPEDAARDVLLARMTRAHGESPSPVELEELGAFVHEVIRSARSEPDLVAIQMILGCFGSAVPTAWGRS